MLIPIMALYNNKYKSHNKIYKDYNRNMIKKEVMILKMINSNNYPIILKNLMKKNMKNIPKKINQKI